MFRMLDVRVLRIFEISNSIRGRSVSHLWIEEVQNSTLHLEDLLTNSH